MNLTIEITKVTVLLTSGMDEVALSTKFPAPISKELSGDLLAFKFNVQQGKGVEYVKNNLGVSPLIISVIDVKVD